MIRMLQRHLILTWKSIFSSYSRCCWLISRALLGLASWYAAAAMIHDTVRTRSTSAPRHLYWFLLFLTLIKSISKPFSVILSILDISARNKLCPSYSKKHIKTFFSVFFLPQSFHIVTANEKTADLRQNMSMHLLQRQGLLNPVM